jgi:hypothetical protein
MSILKDICRIILLSIALASSLVISRIILFIIGFNIPRLPQQADENTAIYYLLVGSFILAGGMFFLIKGIGGSLKEKVLISLLFILFGFAIGVTIESAIYSDTDSYHMTIILLLFPMVIYALISTLITRKKQTSGSFLSKLQIYIKSWSLRTWVQKVLLAIISFPLIYFIFGIVASPFVTAYYDDLIEGLTLPEPGTIILIQLLRSTLFLIITIPIIIYWTKTRTQLILSLGFAHFVMVFAYDIYLAIVMPLELVIIHGIEIVADSFIYSWILINIFYPKIREQKTIR